MVNAPHEHSKVGLPQSFHALWFRRSYRDLNCLPILRGAFFEHRAVTPPLDDCQVRVAPLSVDVRPTPASTSGGGRRRTRVRTQRETHYKRGAKPFERSKQHLLL